MVTILVQSLELKAQPRGFEVATGIDERNSWKSSYQSVNNFLKYYSRKTKSMATRSNVLRQLAGLSAFSHLTPDQLSKLPRKRLEGLVQEHIDKKADEGKALTYVNGIVDNMTIFARVNEMIGDNESLKVQKYTVNARYRKNKEYIPDGDEIAKIILVTKSLRDKALVSTLYTSGLRHGTLLALRYKDIKDELLAGERFLKIPVYPEMKEVNPNACKKKIPYFTFAHAEPIKEYITKERPNIQDDEPVFCKRGETKPLLEGNVNTRIKLSAKLAGIKEWSLISCHKVRKSFEEALKLARVDPDDREILMGHILKGSKDTYDSKRVEYLRGEYAKASFWRGEEIAVKEAFKTLAKEMGLEVKEEQHLDDTIAEIAKVYRAAKNDLEKRSGNGKQRMIREDELDKYLEEGWELVNVLPSGKLVVRQIST